VTTFTEAELLTEVLAREFVPLKVLLCPVVTKVDVCTACGTQLNDWLEPELNPRWIERTIQMKVSGHNIHFEFEPVTWVVSHRVDREIPSGLGMFNEDKILLYWRPITGPLKPGDILSWNRI